MPPISKTLYPAVPPQPAMLDFLRPDMAVADPSVDSVKIGLWDQAFRTDDDKGKLFNEESEAKNFIGSDSRRFYIRVVDPTAKGSRRRTATWTVVEQDGSSAFPTKDDRITLLENPSVPGEFTSRALMLFRHEFDSGVAVHDGLPGGALRKKGQHDFRMRRGGMFQLVKAEYKTAGGDALIKTIPVFQPSERFRLPVHVFILRDHSGQPALDPLDPLWTYLASASQVYETLGIFLQTLKYPFAPAPDGGPNLSKPAEVTGGSPTLYEGVIVDSPPSIDIDAVDDEAVANHKVRTCDLDKIANAFPSKTSTIRIFLVRQFLTSPAIAGITLNNSSGRSVSGTEFGSIFIATRSTLQDEYTLAHELGHLLADKENRLAQGKVVPPTTGDFRVHFHSPTSPNGPLTQHQNLMSPGSLGTQSLLSNGSKRLWDADDKDGFNQVDEIVRKRSTFNLLVP